MAGFGFLATAAMVGTTLAGALLGAAGLSGAIAVVSLAMNLLAAVLAGWLTGRIAGAAPFQHAAALAAVLGVLTVLTASAGPAPGQPAWYAPVAGVLGVTGVLLGGRLRAAAAEVHSS